MELYLIRHGKTRWNEEHRLQGSIDIELAPSGIYTAEQTAAVLKDITFDRVYSSPLKRAHETAKIICREKNVKINVEPELREFSFGVEEGSYYKDWETPDSPFYSFFVKPEDYIPPEKGESIEELFQRTKKFIQRVIEPQLKTANRIMIVGHGALNSAICCYLENRDKAHFWGDGLQQNCQAFIYKNEGLGWIKIQ